MGYSTYALVIIKIIMTTPLNVGTVSSDRYEVKVVNTYSGKGSYDQCADDRPRYISDAANSARENLIVIASCVARELRN